MRRTALIALCAASVALAVTAAPAAARQLVTHSLGSSFDGGGSTAGQFSFNAEPNSVAVDEASGNVYVATTQTGIPIDKFDSSGAPAHFSAPQLAGSTSLFAPGLPFANFNGAHIAVDNSPAPTQGRIYEAYVAGTEGLLNAYEPDGSPAGGNFPLTKSSFSPPVFEPVDVAVDPSSGDIWVAGEIGTAEAMQLTPAGVPTGVAINTKNVVVGNVTVDDEGNVYLRAEQGVFSKPAIYKYNSAGEFQYKLSTSRDIEADPTNGDLYAAEGSQITQYDKAGSDIARVSLSPAPRAIAVNGASGKLYLGVEGAVKIYNPGPTVTVPDLSTGAASNFTTTAVTVHGVVNPDGAATTGCRFEWAGESAAEFAFENSTPCAEGNPSGSGAQPVSATITGLTKGNTYHYRLSASNANGEVQGLPRTFAPSTAPVISGAFVSDVHSDSARFHLLVDPGGAETNYTIEYGAASCALGSCQASTVQSAGAGVVSTEASTVLTGLEPGTTYHYRILATNQSGTAIGTDRTLTTFPFVELLTDQCPNAHVRQQTGAALLLDCRAYELVSAAQTGGYDVESDLVPGQTPFDNYPHAAGRVLYGVHEGAIPGAGAPTNFGVDPYLATRTDNGWLTEYVGIPSDNPFALGPFASGLLEANSSLTSFAFGGENICDPCFEDGSTNVPLRLSDGSLVEGMAGSEKPGPAEPAGYIAKRFAADGKHFVFGTTTKLEPTANSGSTTLYERNLDGGPTEVVSTLPDGSTMTGEVGELDISADGSRVIVGKKTVSSKGNTFWHPYMHIAGSSHSVDLTPGTATFGVLWAGMSDDGSRVFFTTRDKLLPADTDTSADLYEDQVDAEGNLTLRLVSTGQIAPAGNTNSCSPPGAWNRTLSGLDCSVLAIAGDGGIASADGTIYFLSPELLAGASEGIANQPNLYVVSPGGTPKFVATLETSVAGPYKNPAVVHAASQAATHSYGDFQVTPDGAYAVFTSTQSLTGYENGGHSEVFRYAPASAGLVCVSCNPTNAAAVGDATLPAHGLGLTEDGRVFFNSPDPIAPRDLDGKQDAYEYENGEVQLISTGTSPFDSSLLGISSDGTDAFFFTRDNLVPQDENGSLVKIYDARAEGGFPYVPPAVPCKASDECHGRGSETPPPPAIRTLEGENGNSPEEPAPKQPTCTTPKVRRHGRCVKPGNTHRHVHHKRRTSRHG